MHEIATKVRQYYEELGAEPRPGATPQDLVAFEQLLGIQLPPPIAEFYAVLDGLAGEVPNFGFEALQLWPLAEISRVSDRVAAYQGIPDYGPIVDALPDANQYLAFGDGACWSHVLAAPLNPVAGPILWICGAVYAEVAPTFYAFWQRYLEDPLRMLWPEQWQIVKQPHN